MPGHRGGHVAGRPAGLARAGGLNRATRPTPRAIQSDNGPEFTSKALDGWTCERKIEQRFIEPGKPMQNGHIESFNGRRRDECLNEHSSRNLHDARRTIEQWRVHYNGGHPHSALGYQTPDEVRTRGGGSATPPSTPHLRIISDPKALPLAYWSEPHFLVQNGCEFFVSFWHGKWRKQG